MNHRSEGPYGVLLSRPGDLHARDGSAMIFTAGCCNRHLRDNYVAQRAGLRLGAISYSGQAHAQSVENHDRVVFPQQKPLRQIEFTRSSRDVGRRIPQLSRLNNLRILPDVQLWNAITTFIEGFLYLYKFIQKKNVIFTRNCNIIQIGIVLNAKITIQMA